MAGRQRVSERLLEKIRKDLPELEIPEGARLERAAGSHYGWNRSSLGAWVWTVVDADGMPLYKDSEGRPMAIGSHWTMTQLVRLDILVAHRLPHGDICIEPTDEVQRQWGAGAREI